MSTPTHSAGRSFKFIGFLLLAVGVVASMLGSNQIPASSLTANIGFAMMACGFLTFLVGRFQD
jgi:hypothetical protein